ncbi:hypothetical protein BASA81_005543 [Batrachochytrium salamandrivorans]|nr:hypothetical protein BASA81_005543 [Batrachochytrium salamandrivorans]
MVFASRVVLKGFANMPSKYGNKEYYKGYGATKQGNLTSKGRFVPDSTRKKYIMCPGDLSGFELKPFVQTKKNVNWLVQNDQWHAQRKDGPA